MATPEQIQRRWRWSVLLGTLIAALMVAAVAYADNLQSDLNTTTGGLDKTVNLGTLPPGTQQSQDVFLFVQDTSGGNNPTYPFTVTGAKSASSTFPGSTLFDGVTISGAGTGNGQTGHITWTTPAAQPSAQSYSITETFDANTTINESPATVTVDFSIAAAPSDSTPPVITPNVSGILGNNGWYVSDVTVSWSVVDNESAISSSSGCGSTTITTDTDGTTLTCSATSAGGTSSQSVTIKRDATAPTVSGSASPAPNVNGWNNTDVTVSFTCSDFTSGIASCAPDQTLSPEGAGQSATGGATDNAGNSANTTVSGINIDKTAPTASASASPAPNGNGWNNSDVTVTFSGIDAGGSGIDSCDPAIVLSSDGAGQSASGDCTDEAGNVSATATANNINIDKTAPAATANATPAANANGWNNTDVTITFSGSDPGGSGIDFCDPAVVVSSEEAGQSASGDCTDEAGNVSAPAVVNNINIDKTLPTLIWTGGPADGSSHYFGSVPAAPTCVAADALSGPDGCVVTGYGTTVGSHTMTATAKDKAGNTYSEQRSYTVLAWTLNGFFQPVDIGSGVWNAVKGGPTVPLKFRVFAGSTELTETSVVTMLKAAQVACSSGAEDLVEELAPTGGTSLRYDPTGSQFVYNWQTPKQPGKCYRVTVGTADGSTLVAGFKLK